MKKNFTRIMTAFLTMTLLLLNIPVTILAAPKLGTAPVTEAQLSVIYDKEQVDIEGDESSGCIRIYDKPDSKTVAAYGSVWLTLTQYSTDGTGKVDWNNPAKGNKRIVSAKLYEKNPGANDKLATHIASFDETSKTLGSNQQLPNSNESGINIQSGRHGCKILLRPPLDGTAKTYYFVGTTADGRTLRTGDVTLTVKQIAKPLLVPPTVGRTDGFSRTIDNAAKDSSVQVYAKEDIKLADITIKKGSLIINELRKESRLKAKAAELKDVLDKLSDKDKEIYARAIDYRSMDPKWSLNIDTAYLADFRVNREGMEFVTSLDQPPKVAYDRDYVAEVPAIINAKQDIVYYKSTVNASVEYITLTSGLKGLDAAINKADGNNLLIMISTDQNAGFEDHPTKGAVNNMSLWNSIYEGNSVIKYTKNVDKFFTQVKLNIVAMYTGKPESKSQKYTNKTMRAFIFSNQSGQQAGNWFTVDAPTPDVRAQEIPEWSRVMTEIRQKDNQFQVGYATQDLYLYPSAMNDQTILAAWNKCTFVGVDSRVDTYGALGQESYYVDGGEAADSAYYADYYTNYAPRERFLPGTIIFTPSGIVGNQIGYRIVYEEYLLEEVGKKVPALANAKDKINALNALIAMDSDAFEYYTGVRLSQQELNSALYTVVSSSGAMAEEFMIDSVQDFTPLASPANVGTVTYKYGVSGGEINYVIPEGKGCLSYIFKVEDAGLIGSDNLVSKVTTTIDFGKEKDKVYSGGSYTEVTPQTNIDTNALTFIVEEKDGTTYKYDKDLTAAIAGSTIDPATGLLTIEFNQDTGKYFDTVTDYRISVIFPVTLVSPLNVASYRTATDTNLHLPYTDGTNYFARYRLIETNTYVEYQKKPTKDKDGMTTPYPLEKKGPEKEVLALEYKDFIGIQ